MFIIKFRKVTELFPDRKVRTVRIGTAMLITNKN